MFPGLYKTETTLAILAPDATPHMDSILAAIAAAGLCVTERSYSQLAEHRVHDMLQLLGPEQPPHAPPAPSPDLFISAWMEGGKCNKFLQLYNPGPSAVALDGYALALQRGKGASSSSSWPVHRFEAGKLVPAGGVCVLYHPECSAEVTAALPADDRCSMPIKELSNGNDAMALVKLLPDVEPVVVEGAPLPYTVLDCMGVFAAAVGTGGKPWPVAGVVAASKDHTLVRKSSVAAGNPSPWDVPYMSSQGTNTASSEWVVLKKDT